MARYFTDLFSPETYEAFSRSDRSISGFRQRQLRIAGNVRRGDKLVCYMTGLSRWVGLLEVLEGPFQDNTPIFFPSDDPFIVRFRVRPAIWLPVDLAVPIHERVLWDTLSFTRNVDPNTSAWTGMVRSSLRELDESDGRLIEDALTKQVNNGHKYSVDPAYYERLVGQKVRRPERDVTVVVPEERPQSAATDSAEPISETRESHRIQARLAEIGSRMGLQIWIAKADRNAVLAEWRGDHGPLLDRLPLNYDETTLKTIEQIDVLWLRGRSIRRAFEVEHTTSVYSGILRMADLLALQPNMDIRLHIVAPAARRDKVFQEIRRPVFSLLERGPLSESCTFLTYDSIHEVANLPHLGHVNDSVLDEYEEEEGG
jgi:hypothetical protein